ncbi:anti-sigma factor antagonist [Amycolatopsis sp. WQ 127309]|uniref:anti-sigma factor antagonist n=1 Tax=Amycolatopsis sp. WQ 127309 TaxID=2932773 RepID=UPI001FF2ABA6|nr:anti-sigma factor antagonist [Amycolatopsis sp. WQ 127309]UOZ03336.1 anti-sigma factor antagonist [Amycolatopsis sp. WQ 127309]
MVAADGDQVRPRDLLDVTSHDHDRAVLLTVSGEVDLLSGPILDEAITTALADRPPTLLVKTHRAAGDRTRVRVGAPELSVVQPTLQLTGMLLVLDVVPTRAAAVGR